MEGAMKSRPFSHHLTTIAHWASVLVDCLEQMLKVLWNPPNYSGLQNRCNVWPFLTELNVVLNRVGIALRVG